MSSAIPLVGHPLGLHADTILARFMGPKERQIIQTHRGQMNLRGDRMKLSSDCLSDFEHLHLNLNLHEVGLMN